MTYICQGSFFVFVFLLLLCLVCGNSHFTFAFRRDSTCDVKLQYYALLCDAAVLVLITVALFACNEPWLMVTGGLH